MLKGLGEACKPLKIIGNYNGILNILFDQARLGVAGDLRVSLQGVNSREGGGCTFKAIFGGFTSQSCVPFHHRTLKGPCNLKPSTTYRSTKRLRSKCPLYRGPESQILCDVMAIVFRVES